LCPLGFQSLSTKKSGDWGEERRTIPMRILGGGMESTSSQKGGVENLLARGPETGGRKGRKLQ